MTTAHRATFTHAKAKNTTLTRSYQSTLTHKRALPAHTQLKYRIKKRTQEDFNPKGKAGLEIRNAGGGYLDALLQNEEPLSQRKYDISEVIPNDDDDDDDEKTETILVSSIGKLRILGLSNESQKNGKQANKEQQERNSTENSRLNETSKYSVQQIENDIESGNDKDDTSDEEKEKEYDEDSEEEENSEDDDSEDDTEQLLLELQKLTKEKEKKRKAKEELEAEQSAANSNPLMRMDEQYEPKSNKSTWRNTTLFRNQKSSADKNDESLMFTNDTVYSEFHKRFLAKYIR